MKVNFSIKISYSLFDDSIGVNTYHYTADLGDMSTNPEEKCYCPTPDTCLTKNLMDLYKCLGSPVIASLPHFYGSDKKYLEMVQGLDPNKANFSSFIQSSV